MTAVSKPIFRRAKRAPDAADRPTADAHEQRVLEMLPLVRQVASKIRRRLPSHIETDDLVSAGVIGLLDAFRRFDTQKRVPFTTYARFRIQGAILDELRQMDHASRDMRGQSNKVEQARRTLEQRSGRTVSEFELAKELGLSMEVWYQTSLRIEAIRVFEPPRGYEVKEGSFYLERLVDPGADPFQECLRSEIRQILKRACSYLPERQRLILTQCFYESRTLKEIGQALGVDESRVSQLRAHALSRLHKRLKPVLHPRACSTEWQKAGSAESCSAKTLRH